MEDGRKGPWIFFCKHPYSMRVKSVIQAAQRLNVKKNLEERGCGEHADFCRFPIYWH
jgi:hypothetical protein